MAEQQTRHPEKVVPERAWRCKSSRQHFGAIAQSVERSSDTREVRRCKSYWSYWKVNRASAPEQPAKLSGPSGG